MDQELSYAAQAPAPATTYLGDPVRGNFLQYLTGVWFSPSETFNRIGREASALHAWVLPILLVAILTAVASVLPTHRIGDEAVMRKAMEPMVRAGWVPEEVAEKQIAEAGNPSAVMGNRIKAVAQGLIGMIIVLLIVAGAAKLFAVMMGREASFRALLSVVSYAYLAIAVITVPVMAASLYLQEPEDINLYNPVMSNLGAVMSMVAPGINKFLTGLASWIDVFGIWRIILLGIGCAAVTLKMKPGTAVIPHIILYGIIALIFSAFAGMAG